MNVTPTPVKGFRPVGSRAAGRRARPDPAAKRFLLCGARNCDPAGVDFACEIALHSLTHANYVFARCGEDWFEYRIATVLPRDRTHTRWKLERADLLERFAWHEGVLARGTGEPRIDEEIVRSAWVRDDQIIPMRGSHAQRQSISGPQRRRSAGKRFRGLGADCRCNHAGCGALWSALCGRGRALSRNGRVDSSSLRLGSRLRPVAA